MEIGHNYLTEDNGIAIRSVTSEQKGWYVRNILNPHERQIWISNSEFPQEIIFDLRKIKLNPNNLGTFAWKCWHGYTTNPRQWELLASDDGATWQLLAEMEGEKSDAHQIFSIPPINQLWKFLKFVILNTYGAQKTYINQMFLLEGVGTSIYEATRMSPVRNRPSTSTVTRMSPIRNRPSTSTVFRGRLSTGTYIYSQTPVPPEEARLPSYATGSNNFDLLHQKLNAMQDTVSSMQINSQLSSRALGLGNKDSYKPESISCVPRQSAKPEPFPTMPTEIPEADDEFDESAMHEQVKGLENAVSSMKKMISGLGEHVQNQSQSRSQPEDTWEEQMKTWQDTVLTPKLEDIASGLDDKLQELFYGGRPIPSSVRVDKNQVNTLMEELNRKLAAKSKKLKQLDKKKRQKNRPSSPFY